MADGYEGMARTDKEEEALLERCKTFVLASPHSPGGGAKDILYLTPCGRGYESAPASHTTDVMMSGMERCHARSIHVSQGLSSWVIGDWSQRNCIRPPCQGTSNY